MKKVIHKVFSLLMTLIVLISTMTFTINTHFCGGSMVDTAIFSKLKTCGMESVTSLQNSKKITGCSVTKKDCCSNEQILVNGKNELQLSYDKISFDQHILVTTFFDTYTNQFEVPEEAMASAKTFPPPLIIRHIYKLDEAFII